MSHPLSLQTGGGFLFPISANNFYKALDPYLGGGINVLIEEEKYVVYRGKSEIRVKYIVTNGES